MRSPRKPFRDLIQLVNNSDFEVKVMGIHARGRGILGIVVPAIIVLIVILKTH